MARPDVHSTSAAALLRDAGALGPVRALLRNCSGFVQTHGRCGSACLVLVLDPAEGDARRRQQEADVALRARHGARVQGAGALN